MTGQVAPLLEIAAEFVTAKTEEHGAKEVVTHFTAVSDRKEECRRRFPHLARFRHGGRAHA
ncbi:hypothetical protein [Micromonospora sp. NPDC023814]|uniref:hypothetical protein n=1 Tax=Micromonospora sp. NPDC023814 TaxID=3154596 RepID=UPI0033C23277